MKPDLLKLLGHAAAGDVERADHGAVEQRELLAVVLVRRVQREARDVVAG